MCDAIRVSNAHAQSKTALFLFGDSEGTTKEGDLGDEYAGVPTIRAKRLARLYPKSVAVSALTGEGIDLLYDKLADCLKGRKVELRLSVPLSEGKLLSILQKNASILEEEYEGANAELLVRVSAQIAAQCRPFAVED